MAATKTGPALKKAVVFRLTEADRERLTREANEAGLTVQALCERRLLGHENALPKRRWRHLADPTQMELDMTG